MKLIGVRGGAVGVKVASLRLMVTRRATLTVVHAGSPRALGIVAVVAAGCERGNTAVFAAKSGGGNAGTRRNRPLRL